MCVQIFNKMARTLYVRFFSHKDGKRHAVHYALGNFVRSLQVFTILINVLALILIAFITGNSSLEPLIEGLCAQIHVNLR